MLNPQTFRPEKPPGVYRVVCVGGSSTYGRPFFDGTSYPGWLRATLPAMEPSRKWEVINASAISYASYRDVGLMEELAQYSPDLFVVYTGHNEFLERRTSAGLADFAPFKSEHRSGLDEKELSLWNRHFAEAQVHWALGLHAEALRGIQQAEAIDERFAAGWYWKGRILRAMENRAGAKVAFERARDEDVCPLLAIASIAQAVRDLGRRRGKEVVDFEAIAARQCNQGLTGCEFFHDHVHLSIEANRQMSLAIVERLREMEIVKPEEVWDEAAQERLKGEVLTGVDRGRHAGELRHLAAMLGWLKQSDMARRQADLSLELSGPSEDAYLDLATRWRGNGATELAVEYCRKALAAAGNSARLWSGLGFACLDAGEATEGIRSLEKAITIQPDDAEGRTRLGIALALRGDLEEAAVHLKEAVRLRPDSGTVRGNYGLVLARQGKPKEAIEVYESALELDPASPSVHFNLGQAMEGIGDLKSAADHYRCALRAQPNHAKAQERLVSMAGSAGPTEAESE